jgi:uncharacterized membrane protein
VTVTVALWLLSVVVAFVLGAVGMWAFMFSMAHRHLAAIARRHQAAMEQTNQPVYDIRREACDVTF